MTRPSKIKIDRWLVLTNLTSSVLTHVINVTVMLWVHQHLLRRINPDEYSIYPVVMGLIALIPMVTMIFLSGMGRFASEAYARDDLKRITQIVSSMLPLLGVASLVLMAGCLVVCWKIEPLLSIPSGRAWDGQLMLTLLTASAIVRIVLTPYGLGLFVHQRFIAINLIRLVGQALRLAILLVLLYGISTRIVWVAVAAAVTEIMVAAVTAILSKRVLPELRFSRKAFSWSVAREMSAFGFWHLVGNMAMLVRTTMVPLILMHYSTPLDVACYGLATMFRTEAQRVIALFHGPIQPPLSALYAIGDTNGLRDAYIRGNRFMLWAIALGVAPLLVFSSPFVELYAGETYSLLSILIICAFAALPLRMANVMMAPISTATARVRPMAVRNVVIRSVELAMVIYLVIFSGYGAREAALAGLGVELVFVPLLLWGWGWKVSDTRPGDWLRGSVFPAIFPIVAGVAVWLTLQLLVSPDSWLALIGCVLAGAVAYLVVLVLFSFNEQERQDLNRILQSIRKGEIGRIKGLVAESFAPTALDKREDDRDSSV
ncbi:MAG: lipopolysaccharide biosynthesis protein [Planctomycetota bacterium]|jgi:O-antigen/teichoic acid export membrane protein